MYNALFAVVLVLGQRGPVVNHNAPVHHTGSVNHNGTVHHSNFNSHVGDYYRPGYNYYRPYYRSGYDYYRPSYDYYRPSYDYPKYYPPTTYYTPRYVAPDYDTTTVCVNCPWDAVVWVDGARTYQTGAYREFITPQLETFVTHCYTIRAKWWRDGREINVVKNIKFKAGEKVSVTFLAPELIGY